ncbi:FAD-dependent oxidoreductase, partial [Eubacterium aggregans]
IGGGAVGLDVVEFMAPRGARVAIVEMLSEIGKDLDPVSRSDTNALMEKYTVEKLTSTKLVEVKADAFVLEKDGEHWEQPFDYGFICMGMRANTPMLKALNEDFDGDDVEVVNIGDSLRARRIIDWSRRGTIF